MFYVKLWLDERPVLGTELYTPTDEAEHPIPAALGIAGGRLYSYPDNHVDIELSFLRHIADMAWALDYHYVLFSDEDRAPDIMFTEPTLLSIDALKQDAQNLLGPREYDELVMVNPKYKAAVVKPEHIGGYRPQP
jgi:hypothetical protein